MTITNDISSLKKDAIHIGELILDNADALRCPLPGLHSKKENFPAGIADGTSGVILYLLELYKQTSDLRYLKAVEDGVSNVIYFSDKEKTRDYSFFTGHLGVAYTLLHFYKITADARCLEETIKITKKSAELYLNYPHTSNTLFTGRAGSILTLLHLHAITGERWILNLINSFVKRIVEDVKHGYHGLYWRGSNCNVRGLCGFAFGASGIGYIFLELGHYFRNEAFYHIAEQAFIYENFYWNKQHNNWPDYKKEIKDPEAFFEHKKNFRTGNLTFFEESEDTTSYAHGTAGIGFSRISAHQLLGSKSHLDDINAAFKKIKETFLHNSDRSIYNGQAGYGLFALEAYRVTRNSEHLQFAKEIASGIGSLNSSPGGERNALDFSLYKGISGIGYFLLQLQDPFNTQSVILPGVSSTLKDVNEIAHCAVLNSSKEEIRKMLLQKIFGRTICILESIAPDELKNYFKNSTEIHEKEKFQEFIEHLAIDKKYQALFNSIYSLDLAKIKMADAIKSDALIHMRDTFHMEEMETFFGTTSRELFLETYVTIHKEVKIFKTCYNPALPIDYEFSEDSLHSEKIYQVVLKPTSQLISIKEIRKSREEYFPFYNTSNVQEIYLNEIQNLLFSALDKPKKIKSLVEDLLAIPTISLLFDEREDPALWPTIIINQIKDDLISEILMPFHVKS